MIKHLKNHRGKCVYILVLLALSGVYLVLRPNRAVMNAAASAARRFQRAFAFLCSAFPFSVTEALIILAAIALVLTLTRWVALTLRRGLSSERIWGNIFTVSSVIITAYFLMSVLYGAGNYADSFAELSGIEVSAVSGDELYRVTARFAEGAARAGAGVPRDASGLFTADINEIIEKSKNVMDRAADEFPFLSGRALKPKKMIFSRVMSWFNYTGFFSPLTGEAQINADSPICMIPATIAHEIAHQRGVISEAEANFVAVLACLDSGIPEFEYSGYLLGFSHLVNALGSADPELASEAWGLLGEAAVSDLAANYEYWREFETPVADFANGAYDAFLKGHGQELGVKSYGACVDLLISYYGGHDMS